MGVDNTLVNLGCRDSTKTWIVNKNPAACVMECPCHIVHNTVGKTGDAFEVVSWWSLIWLACDLVALDHSSYLHASGQYTDYWYMQAHCGNQLQLYCLGIKDVISSTWDVKYKALPIEGTPLKPLSTWLGHKSTEVKKLSYSVALWSAFTYLNRCQDLV